ncbi:MAG: protease inhibitor I42 family protein [Thermodesulfobacteriota bacterium]
MVYGLRKKACLSGFHSLLIILGIVIAAAAGVTKMNVSLGKEFNISLEANPTTGYTWEANYDAHFLKLKGKRFEPLAPKGRETMPLLGSPGKAVFTFIPLKTGQTTIKMIYQRPWEKTPAQEEEFTVVINEGG